MTAPSHARGRDAESRSPEQRRALELLQVLLGTVDVEVAEDTTRLKIGDAVTFPGDVEHAYANGGPEPARFSLAVLEPGVGGRSRGGAAHA